MLPPWLLWLFRAAWSIISFPVRLLQWLLGPGDEAYASFDHLALNVTRPKTEWLNMGNWQVRKRQFGEEGATQKVGVKIAFSDNECEPFQNTNDFPTACNDLAELLYKEAGVYPGASILDVGHGSGDSLLLLAKQYNPKLLHGVTSIPSHASRARSRMEEAEKQSLKSSHPPWQVYCDDAIKFLGLNDEPTYDFILALDCAYHFHTRRDFLSLCKTRLKPGGRVALVDLVASHPYPSSIDSTLSSSFTPSPTLPPPPSSRSSLLSQLKHYVVTLLSGVPLINLVSINQYHTDLCQAGFSDLSIKDTSHLIFPGFAKFLQRIGKDDEAAWRGGGRIQMTALNSFGSIVEEWSKGGQTGMVRSVVVVAQSSEIS